MRVACGSKGGVDLYARRYYRQTPPGYSGVAFAPPEDAEKEQASKKQSGNGAPAYGGQSVQSTPAPVEGAGADRLLHEKSRRETLSPSADRPREEAHLPQGMPRDFSFTAERQAAETASSSNETADAKAVFREEATAPTEKAPEDRAKDLLHELFSMHFTLEDLLLIGMTLLLASEQAEDDTLVLFSLVLLLISRKDGASASRAPL